MSGPLRFDQLDTANQSRIRRNLAKMEKGGASDAEVEDYLANTEHLAPKVDIHEQYRTGELQQRVAEANARDQAEIYANPSTLTKVLGAIGSTAPKGSALESLQAVARAGASHVPLLNRLYGGQSMGYREALSDIQHAKDAAPKAATIPLGIAGQGLLAAALPGNAVVQNALAGGLEGALGSNRDWTDVKGRAFDTALQGTLSSLLAKGGETATSLSRVGLSRALGRTATKEAAKAATTAGAEAVRRGAAAAEDQASGLLPFLAPGTESAAARRQFLEALKHMTPAEARAAREGFLAQAGQGLVPDIKELVLSSALGVSAHSPKAIAALIARRAATTAGRVGPTLRALDEAAGGVQLQDLARLLGVSLTNPLTQSLGMGQPPARE